MRQHKTSLVNAFLFYKQRQRFSEIYHQIAFHLREGEATSDKRFYLCYSAIQQLIFTNIIEGEEEESSIGISSFNTKHLSRLTADLLTSKSAKN